MSPGEVLWRLAQKGRQLHERLRFGRRYHKVDSPLYRCTRNVRFNPAPLGLITNSEHPIDTSHSIHLPGGFNYRDYSTDWHAGFQTPAQWPVKWSYGLCYKQRDDIGDARTNWELNRLAQFTLMAKAYYLTADEAHLRALQTELDSWTRCNPFLWGISWTSPMEIALRAINWMYAAAFLSKADSETDTSAAEQLIRRLSTGAANMVHYLTRHYSRGSSANNHLLVEMSAIWLGGACFGRRSWRRLAMRTLTRELPRQFAPDGVNLEMSLHYHAFAMEAYLLVMHSARACGAKIPASWAPALDRAAQFVAHSRVAPGVVCQFGDNDEGHILNFTPHTFDYYTYILQFCSLILDKRYDSLDKLNPTSAWLFCADEVARVRTRPLYRSETSHTFATGGYTFLRSGNIFAGVDHAPLGFGTIAAHGHADALSFQLFIGGRPLLVDPGTYIYHCDLNARNRFRSTLSHNTVAIDGGEQSEMLGPFLWGKRAHTTLISHTDRSVEAMTVNQAGTSHTRRVSISETGAVITDRFSRRCRWTATFMAAPGLEVTMTPGAITFGGIATLTYDDGIAEITTAEYSPAYGQKVVTCCVRVSGEGVSARFEIRNTLT